MTIQLTIRKSIPSDLEVFYLNQIDEETNHMAAFTPPNPHDKVAYLDKWQRLMQKESVHMQTVVIADKAIGCVVKFVLDGTAEITYAIQKDYWGQGITTEAVKQFLVIEKTRPIFGRVAFDNIGSQKILERAGFNKIKTEMSFANARGAEIEEYIYRLDI